MLRRSATRWVLPALLLAGGAWTTARADEGVDRHRIEIGVEGGFFLPDKDVSNKDNNLQQIEPLGGVRFGMLFGRFFDWFIDADFADINTNTIAADVETVAVRTGIDFYFSEHWVLNFEASYVLPTGDLSEYDYIGGGMGLAYRF